MTFLKVFSASTAERPVKIVDVNGDGLPQIVNLPNIEPKMSIEFSPGASFVFGLTSFGIENNIECYVWKRITENTTMYNYFILFHSHEVQCPIL